MKSIIEEIFYGNRGNIESINFGEDYQNAHTKECELFEKMENVLNEKQKKMLNKIFWARCGTEAEAVKAAYTEGFKLGLSIAAECLTK